MGDEALFSDMLVVAVEVANAAGEGRYFSEQRMSYDRHSNIGRGCGMKNDGAGQPNWGTSTDENPTDNETEDNVNSEEKTLHPHVSFLATMKEYVKAAPTVSSLVSNNISPLLNLSKSLHLSPLARYLPNLLNSIHMAAQNKITPIAILEPGMYRQRIKGRITKLWTAHSATDGKKFSHDFILVDKENTAIEGFIKINDPDENYLLEQIEEGLVYEFYKFIPTFKREGFRTIEHNARIQLTAATKITKVQNDDAAFPLRFFDFKSLNSIGTTITGDKTVVEKWNLTTYSATRIYQDQFLPEITTFRRRIASKNKQLTLHEATPLEEQPNEQLPPSVSIKELHDMCIPENKDKSFNVVAKISDTLEELGWYYEACPIHRTKVKEPSYFCYKCRTNVRRPLPWLNFKLIVADNTSEAHFSFIGKHANDLLGSSAQDLLYNSSNKEKKNHLPPIFGQLINKEHLFTVQWERNKFTENTIYYHVTNIQDVPPTTATQLATTPATPYEENSPEPPTTSSCSPKPQPKPPTTSETNKARKQLFTQGQSKKQRTRLKIGGASTWHILKYTFFALYRNICQK
ncbi:Replication factor-A C terminal domain-containing protein [Carex littledalei]|uniref:Replication factor-A C terminal domain-containing protein n=1 Tax=Carex littledalei TaxID=544730 RepID=A0A833R380_9POAL|nr:Replication factor-A C terminal domain-containing protein [Carex littledalei]